MKIALSPAKSLDFESALPTEVHTQPRFLEEAQTLKTALAKKSRKALGKLMGISNKLADLNYGRYQNFSLPHTADNARPAVYTFSGDVYVGLDAYTIPAEKTERMQESLRILSGMYGLLRPLDLIQPYRLEMGTELRVNRKKNLYAFWGDRITRTLNEDLNGDELFLNLASVEYFKSVNPDVIETRVVSPVFKDFKDGQLKIISFFAKKARGSMARYVVDTDAKTYDELLGFDYDGYRYSETHTESADKPVFVR